jgi:D-alanyl-D-alanine carboxypeptidase (penicillin-binding protein 5/6)
MNSSEDAPDSRRNRFRGVRVLGIAAGSFLAICAVLFLSRVYALKHPAPRNLAADERAALDSALAAYNTGALRTLPYKTAPANLPLSCGSAIVFDAANGSVLYEKNTDGVIPPASLTKIAVMYIVFQKIAAGEISLDDIVPLPPESWAVNAPPGSSLMYLAEGQRVTLRELLLGMSVPSANDAAVAIACYIAGSVDQFCALMNRTMRGLGLTNTVFVDASGYSELNFTTPREFAEFLRVYLLAFPESLADFHSARTFTYRQTTFTSTNPALGVIQGCDGIKTGFIPESGYNFSFTVKRGGTRIVALTMAGPGVNSREGSRYRLNDAAAITSWAFDSFATRGPDSLLPIPLPLLGGKENALALVPAYERALTVPAIARWTTPQEAAENVKTELVLPYYANAPVARGAELGKIVHSLNGVILEEIPLVADRSVERGSFIAGAADSLAKAFFPGDSYYSAEFFSPSGETSE